MVNLAEYHLNLETFGRNSTDGSVLATSLVDSLVDIDLSYEILADFKIQEFK